MSPLSLPKERVKILLLEGVHQSAIEQFKNAGYSNIDYIPHALSHKELLQTIREYHFVGIRSRSQLNKEVLEAAKKLVAIGCFCIGTNQVDLHQAKKFAVPVFNAPYGNTRSVAELVLGEMIMLMRGIPEKSAIAHRGGWLKSAKDSYELRGKTLGVVGYGHIGTQIGILAENLGMHVLYYDIESKLPLGNATPAKTLKKLLQQSDIVTLHVPQTAQTKNMIGFDEIKNMKKGSHLINASRGTVVVIDALAEALKTKHLLGAAIDVFPIEPTSKDAEFVSPLRDFDNVILSPHIGGSTLEAQENIGREVSQKLIKYSDLGITALAVNFPEVNLPPLAGRQRYLHIHKNHPGVVNSINELFSKNNLNISGQYLQTDEEIGYVVLDIDSREYDAKILQELKEIPGTLRARALY